MNSAKPVIALNLPETGPGPKLRDYFRVCVEKPGNVLKAHAFGNKKLTAFIDMVDDLMSGERGGDA
jgi:hypothetical protein